MSVLHWVPGVESCTVHGDIRIAVLGDRTLTEQFEVDPRHRRLTYRIIASTGASPLSSHEGIVEVLPHETGSRVVYRHEFEPADVSERVRASCAGALRTLKRYLEGGVRVPRLERAVTER